MNGESFVRATALLACWVVAGCQSSEALSKRGAGPAPASDDKMLDNGAALPIPLQPSAAGAAAPSSGTALAGCAPGVFTGTYDIGFLGIGPIMFELVAGEKPASGSVPCLEFCPDLVLSSEGGEFFAAWIGFAGQARLKGGLDCRSGEFRGEMVDGMFGLSDGDPGKAVMGGALTGTFTGQFRTGATPGISGEIQCNAGVDVMGTFVVDRAP